ncbi:LOW QUALITY PROTEIN: D-alanyl-D-alanine carboxypeptidase [Vibrio sp. JCM 18904]|nr:LOW QUALITY PROTEIN: D-alanyl-D-alanine carboxypeptidase [Vibrio sp. JCM 18904]
MLITGFAAVSSLAYAAPSVVPNAPELSSRGYVLMDFHTGKVLVERDAHKRLNPPASLTKLMTAYVAGQEINTGNITLNDEVVISRNAWAKNFPDSSKMFIEVNTSVSLSDLYRGLIVQSGNDASVAIAEHVAGSESGFVSLMNSWAAKLELSNTAFTNHGLDSDGLYSTPYDIAKLGQAIIRDLPDIYPLYSETSFTYNGITQYNRNGLLRDRSMNVDGMKTGYTSGAGYSLATSATQGDMRLIAVVMGAKSENVRESESKQLLSYGFRFYDTVMPTEAGAELAKARVWMGEKDELTVGVANDVYLTLPKGDVKNLQAEVEYNGDLVAPISEQQVVGKVLYKVDGKVVNEAELVALESVEEGSLFKRILDWFKQLVASWF